MDFTYVTGLVQQGMRVCIVKLNIIIFSFQEAYVAKVEQFVKLKQKQEEDKAAVRLHCFRSVITIA